MTKTARALEIIETSKHKMSIETVLRRFRNGWSDEKIRDTPVQKKPPMDHLLKRPCYLMQAKRKGWDLNE